MMPGDSQHIFPMGMYTNSTNTWMAANGVNGFTVGSGGILYRPMITNNSIATSQHLGAGVNQVNEESYRVGTITQWKLTDSRKSCVLLNVIGSRFSIRCG